MAWKVVCSCLQSAEMLFVNPFAVHGAERNSMLDLFWDFSLTCSILFLFNSETSTCVLSLLCSVVDSIYLQLNVLCWSVDPYIVCVHQKSSKPHSDNIWHPTHGYNLKLLKIISKIQIVGPSCLPRHLNSYKVNDVWDESFKYIIIKST